MMPAWLAARRHAVELDVLGVLLNATATGAALPEALAAAEGRVPRRARTTLRTVREALVTGSSLAGALARADMNVPLVATANAGEQSGRLHEALAAHERSLEWRLEFRRRALDAWAQPLFSLLVAFATLALLLMAGALPAFVSLTEQPGPLARFVSDIASLPGPLPLALLAGFALTCLALSRALADSARWQRFRERIPIVGAAVRERQRALALRELASLVASGVPIQDALAHAGRTLPMGSSARRSLMLAAERMSGGEIPGAVIDWPLLHALLATGAPPDTLAARIRRAADWHEAEMDRIADETARASGIVASATAWIACGTLIVLAWSGYFAAVTVTGN